MKLFLVLVSAALLVSSCLADDPSPIVRVLRTRQQRRGRENFGTRILRRPKFVEVVEVTPQVAAAQLPIGPAFVSESRVEPIGSSYSIASEPILEKETSPSAETLVVTEPDTAYAAPNDGSRTVVGVQAPLTTSTFVVRQPESTVSVASNPRTEEVVRYEPVALPSNTVITQTRVNNVVGLRPKPIPIVRSSLNAPGTAGFERAFGYSFEAGNGIKQEAAGNIKRINDADVMVMSGSYEYIGSDGLTYVVDWYADETGYHPSAPHLPKPVEIPFPEQAAAVEAQLRFAAEQRRLNNDANDVLAAAASNSYSASVVAPAQVVVEAKEARQLPNYSGLEQ